MIYGVGGKKSDPARTALVRAQPEQRCSQYSTDANNNASRFALTSGRSLIGTTLGGISRVSRRTTFFTQGITVSPDTPPCRKNINLRECGGGKACSLRQSHFSATNTATCVPVSVRHRTQRAFSRARAVGPAVESPARVRPGRPIPHSRKAELSPAPLFQNRCGLPSSLPCKAEERSGQIRVVDGCAFVARRRPQIVLNADLASLAKVHPDHVAHVFVSMSAATRLARLGVFQ